MITEREMDISRLAVELFDPEPGALYNLDITAHLSGVARRRILIYCKSGLVRPHQDPGYGSLYFNDEAIQRLRRLEYLRCAHGISLTGLRMIFDLLSEVERLKKEITFLRGA